MPHNLNMYTPLGSLTNKPTCIPLMPSWLPGRLPSTTTPATRCTPTSGGGLYLHFNAHSHVLGNLPQLKQAEGPFPKPSIRSFQEASQTSLAYPLNPLVHDCLPPLQHLRLLLVLCGHHAPVAPLAGSQGPAYRRALGTAQHPRWESGKASELGLHTPYG